MIILFFFLESFLALWIIRTSHLVLCTIKIQMMMQKPSLNSLTALTTVDLNTLTLLFLMIDQAALGYQLVTIDTRHRQIFTISYVFI